MKSFLLSIGAIMLLTTCVESIETNTVLQGETSADYKSYYYPTDKLSETKVYHYAPGKAGTDHLFWELTTTKENGKTYLVTDSYTLDSTGVIKHVEIIKEEVNETGSFVKNYTEFQYTDYGKQYEVPAEMESECVFKWKMTENDTMTWRFASDNKIYPGYITRVERKRNFNGETTIVQFDNKEIEAIVLSDSFTIEYINSQLNDHQEMDFTQTSHYAEGVGLYKFVRHSNGGQMTYTLDEILTSKEWEKLKKEK